MIQQFLFWATLGLIAYTYFGFPLVLLVRGLLQRRPVAKAPISPEVSLIIVAHNEVAGIKAKLQNVLELDYPRAKLAIIIASDGSDDGTNEIVASYASQGVELLALPRTGKIPALNAAAAKATGDILVLSDANSIYAPDAVSKLIAPFADPAVGAVGGDQRYLSSDRDAANDRPIAGFGERLYWSYDRLLKVMQSTAGNMTSATGAIHAIRRELFRPVPLGVSDDFVISVRAIAQGYRLVFERNAIAYEKVAPTDDAEFTRKVRVIVRGLRGLWAVKELFNPFRAGFYAVQMFSHKLLRWSVCWLLLLLFAVSVSLHGTGSIYTWLTWGQIAFYGFAVTTLALRHTPLAHRRAFRLFSIPYYFCLANYAALRAWLQLYTGKRIDVWDSARVANT